MCAIAISDVYLILRAQKPYLQNGSATCIYPLVRAHNDYELDAVHELNFKPRARNVIYVFERHAW